MAVIDINFYSNYLRRNVSIKAILPIDKFSFTGDEQWNGQPFKTLYLLHGAFDDQNSWLNNSRILRWASEKNLAVIFPAGENMFFIDAPGINGEPRKSSVGEEYSKFIGEELIEFSRNLFPLSRKREDTFIGGLSMGGYGAIYNGCIYNHVFSHIAALSPALMIDDAISSTYRKAILLRNRAFFERFYGNLDNLKESDHNLHYLIERMVKENIQLPEIYLSCGNRDHLFERVKEFSSFITNLGVKCTFEEAQGDHNWDFWDEYIQHIINWLPL